jgi:hypothetical protein
VYVATYSTSRGRYQTQTPTQKQCRLLRGKWRKANLPGIVYDHDGSSISISAMEGG